MEPSSEKIDEILKNLTGSIPEVKATAFVSMEGLPIASSFPQGVDEIKLTALTASLFALAELMVIEMDRGDFDKIYEVRGNGDNSIVVDENFKNLSEGADLLSHIRPDIKHINFDYFLGNSELSKNKHSQRNYQGEGVALCLIPLNANEPQDIDQDVPHSKNVFVLNPKGFAAFLGYKGEVYDKFIESV